MIQDKETNAIFADFRRKIERFEKFVADIGYKDLEDFYNNAQNDLTLARCISNYIKQGINNNTTL